VPAFHSNWPSAASRVGSVLRTQGYPSRALFSSRALFATLLLIIEAYQGFGWRALSSGEPDSLLPRRQCHGPFTGSFRLISLFASVPVTRRGHGIGGPVRAAFRLLVWRPVRVRAGGERGRRFLDRGVSLAGRPSRFRSRNTTRA